MIFSVIPALADRAHPFQPGQPAPITREKEEKPMAIDPIPRPRLALAEARQQRGWSQEELANLIGTTQVNVSRWERGITTPGPYFRRKVATLFGKGESELALRPAESAEATDRHGWRAVFDPLLPHPPASELIGRAALLERIKHHLVDAESVALTALDGLPGVGKTTLAISLAYDEEIRLRFSDGILWAGVGPAPNLPDLLSRWGALLGIPPSEIARLGNLEAWAAA
jgi:transcriptional regulator with XRE-family HTH domain